MNAALQARIVGLDQGPEPGWEQSIPHYEVQLINGKETEEYVGKDNGELTLYHGGPPYMLHPKGK